MADGGELTTVGSIYMGKYASGTAYQTGETLTVGSGLNVGLDTSPDGTYGYGEYNLSGGTLTTDYTSIGPGAQGVFNHTAGLHDVQQDISISGTSDSNNGTYNLSGSGEIQAKNLGMGSGSSIATMNQSGGSATITDHLIFNNSSGYHLTGGQLSGASLGVGVHGTGIFELSGGQADFTDESFGTPIGKMQVGDFDGSSGSMVVSGTRELVTDYLTVGYYADATSVLTQTGGTIGTTVRTRVQNGQLQQTGGTLRMARGTGHSVEVGTSGTGGVWLMGNAGTTGSITEQG